MSTLAEVFCSGFLNRITKVLPGIVIKVHSNLINNQIQNKILIITIVNGYVTQTNLALPVVQHSVAHVSMLLEI